MSGFTIPNVVSDEFAEFCGLNHGTRMSRIEMNNHLYNYIKNNNLSNGRNIHADEKLTNLLKHDEQLTYFNIQRYTSKHVMH
jgi:chromatin remodeling complex protein RSC6